MEHRTQNINHRPQNTDHETSVPCSVFHGPQGFSLLEMIVSIGVGLLILSVTIVGFVEYNRREAVKSESIAVAEALRDARAKTLASVGASQYGIKIDSDRYTFFKGGTFSSSTPGNITFIFSPWVRASSTISTFVFQRVTGNSSASGTIDVYIAPAAKILRTIYIQSTGLVSLQ
jgi:prepilin-type N-terminal cleavage/methylation domain-containing protein